MIAGGVVVAYGVARALRWDVGRVSTFALGVALGAVGLFTSVALSDVRWDYYFNPGEFISFGLFLKEFDRPIENVLLASGGTFLTTFDNADTAENYGFEFELYKTFDFLDEWWGWGDVPDLRAQCR